MSGQNIDDCNDYICSNDKDEKILKALYSRPSTGSKF